MNTDLMVFILKIIYLPNKIKDGAYVINLDEHSDIETHWVDLYVYDNNVTYFDSFGVEHISKEIKAFINRSLSITTSIFRIQAYDSIRCGYFCIGFIDFMLKGKNLTEYTYLFSPAGSGIDNNNKTKQNIQLAEELHKPIIRNFKKRTVYSRFEDNIWGVNLADM